MLLLLGVYDISTLDLVESWQLLRNADELPALKSASNSIFFQSGTEVDGRFADEAAGARS